MPQDIRNVFVSHIHEDDQGVAKIKELSEKRGLTIRNYSITSDKFNNAKSPDYIKYQILAPHIQSCSVLVTYISRETKDSEWVNWEIEYAHKLGKRIVGVWERGAKDCELPDALDRYADAIVGWNGESVVDAINGSSDEWYQQDGSKRNYRPIRRHSCK